MTYYINDDTRERVNKDSRAYLGSKTDSLWKKR